MRTALFETSIQLPIIVALWVWAARHALAVRARTGSSPAAISPFAWGALVGLTWVAALPFLVQARRPAPERPERDLVAWWPVLALVAAAWTAVNAAAHDTANVIEHGLLTVIILCVWVVAMARASTRRTTPEIVG